MDRKDNRNRITVDAATALMPTAMKSAEAALRNVPRQLDHSRQPSGLGVLIDTIPPQIKR